MFQAIIAAIIVAFMGWLLQSQTPLPPGVAWSLVAFAFALGLALTLAWLLYGDETLKEIRRRRDLQQAKRSIQSFQRILAAGHVPEIPPELLAFLSHNASELSAEEFKAFLALREIRHGDRMRSPPAVGATPASPPPKFVS